MKFADFADFADFAEVIVMIPTITRDKVDGLDYTREV